MTWQGFTAKNADALGLLLTSYQQCYILIAELPPIQEGPHQIGEVVKARLKGRLTSRQLHRAERSESNDEQTI